MTETISLHAARVDPASVSRPPELSLSAEAQQLIGRRRRLIFTLVLIGIAFYLSQVVLSVFTTVLNGFVAGPLSWGWLLAFAQLLVPLVILQIYQLRSAVIDRDFTALAEYHHG